jgi:hypothetical protein
MQELRRLQQGEQDKALLDPCYLLSDGREEARVCLDADYVPQTRV